MPPKYESTFTQRVIEMIENARLDAGVSVQELIERSGIRRSTYFRKMRGETTFTTEDVDALASALGLDPLLVLSSAATQRRSNLIVGGFGKTSEHEVPEDVEEAWAGQYAADPAGDDPIDHGTP